MIQFKKGNSCKTVKQRIGIFTLFLFFASIIYHISDDLIDILNPEIPCHEGNSNYSFPKLAKNVLLPQRSIFFIETSCFGNLTARQHCAIESAANSNPNWQINVIFLRHTSFDTIEKFKEIEKSNNVKFWNIDIEEFSNGTPLEELVQSNILKKFRGKIERTLVVLKYLILLHWGGIYIDLDIIVAKPLGSLARDWAVRENDDAIAEGILKFSKDSVIAETTVRYIQSNLKKRRWCDNPRVLDEVLQTFCSTPDPAFMSSATCNGFEVYGPQFFFPVPKERARDYFTAGDLENYNAYAYCFWGQDTYDYRMMRNSPFSKLAKRFCPRTDDRYFGDDFGTQYMNCLP